MDHSKKCQHRDARVVRAYYDANGAYRVKHAFDACKAAAVAVDVHGYGYCADHRDNGDYGQPVDPSALDAALRRLLGV